jgi:uncharacterized RDD family membrane protein YckC
MTQPMPLNNNAMHYSGFWRRFVAAAVDSVVVMVTAYIPFFLVPMTSLASIGIAYALSLIVSLAYYTLMEASVWQATVGKRIVGLSVATESGARLSLGRALFRNLCKVISVVILMIGGIMAAFTKRKQGLHDILAKTVVVDRRQESVGIVIGIFAASVGLYMLLILFMPSIPGVPIVIEPAGNPAAPKVTKGEEGKFEVKEYGREALLAKLNGKLQATEPMSVMAGPVLLKKWQSGEVSFDLVADRYNFIMRIPIVLPETPEVDVLDKEAVTVDILYVLSNSGYNLYDKAPPSEQQKEMFLHKLGEGKTLGRDIQLVPGVDIKETDIAGIAGIVNLALPKKQIEGLIDPVKDLNRSWSFPGKGTIIIQKAAEDNNFIIKVSSELEKELRITALDASGTIIPASFYNSFNYNSFNETVGYPVAPHRLRISYVLEAETVKYPFVIGKKYELPAK